MPSITNAGATPEVQGPLTRIKHQLDNVMSTMAKTHSKSEAVLNACQYSPRYTSAIDSKMTRLEERMEQLMKMVGNRPQESTGPKIAAYQPTAI